VFNFMQDELAQACFASTLHSIDSTIA